MAAELAVEDTDFLFRAHRTYPFSPQLDPNPDDVLDSLVGGLRTTMASLDQAVQALAKAALAAVHRIQEDTRHELVEQRGEATAIPLEVITVHVASALHIAPDKLRSRSRKQHVAFARQVAMFMCRKLTSKSFPAIGEHFNRDHSTCIHAYQLIERRTERDAAFRLSIEKLERQLTASTTSTAAAA